MKSLCILVVTLFFATSIPVYSGSIAKNNAIKNHEKYGNSGIKFEKKVILQSKVVFGSFLANHNTTEGGQSLQVTKHSLWQSEVVYKKYRRSGVEYPGAMISGLIGIGVGIGGTIMFANNFCLDFSFSSTSKCDSNDDSNATIGISLAIIGGATALAAMSVWIAKKRKNRIGFYEILPIYRVENFGIINQSVHYTGINLLF